MKMMPDWKHKGCILQPLRMSYNNGEEQTRTKCTKKHPKIEHNNGQ